MNLDVVSARPLQIGRDAALRVWVPWEREMSWICSLRLVCQGSARQHVVDVPAGNEKFHQPRDAPIVFWRWSWWATGMTSGCAFEHLGAIVRG